MFVVTAERHRTFRAYIYILPADSGTPKLSALLHSSSSKDGLGDLEKREAVRESKNMFLASFGSRFSCGKAVGIRAKR